MISSVGGISSAYPLSTSTAATSEKSSSSELSTKQGDVVNISSEGMKAQLKSAEMVRASNEKEDAANPGSKWLMTSLLKDGRFTMENGNEQKVSIDGNELEILEFDNGRLVKSVTGTINADGATLNTEYYDRDGDVIQSIQTDILELPGVKGWSSASMSRRAQWFEDGKLKGEMQDSMILSSWNSTATEDDEYDASSILSLLNKGTDKVVPSIEAMKSSITVEKHIASYHADVKEYGLNGRVSREIAFDHEGRYKQLSNRSNEDMGNLAARSTRELEHKTDLSITIKDYDEDGNLIRDASFRDRQKDKADSKSDGKLEQSMSVSWYNDGELIRQSHGSLSKEETPLHQLRDRPGIVETLGLSSEGYLGSEPQSAVDLLSKQFLQSSSEPDFFMEGVNRLAGANAYSTAEAVATNGNPDQPYSIDWTDELYREGELVRRKRDAESARESLYEQRYRRVHFQTGLQEAKSLTGNEVPTVVRETSHEREHFKDGELISHQTMEARESIERSYGGPDKVVTNAVVTQGTEGNEVTTAMKIDGKLTVVDPEPNSAAKGMSTEVELTLDDMRETKGKLNQGDVTKREALHVRFNYKHMWD